MSDTQTATAMIEEITRTEIARLHKKQKDGPLDIVDIKQLVELSRAWKNLTETPPPKEGGSVDHLTLDQLLAMAVDDEVEPSKHTSSKAETEEPSEC